MEAALQELAQRWQNLGQDRHIVIASAGNFSQPATGSSPPLLQDGLRAAPPRPATAALRRGEAHSRAILDAALDCVITMDYRGRILEWNPAAAATFGYAREEAVGCQVSELIVPAALRARHEAGLARHLATGSSTILGRRVETSGQRRDGSEFPIELTVVRAGADEPPVFTAFLRDVSARKQADDELRRLNRTLQVLSACNQALVRAKSESELLDIACRDLVEIGGFRLAWVGIPEHDPARSVRVVARAGLDDGYLDQARITWADAEHGRGPTGTALRSGRPALARNLATDPTYAPWREAALQRGYAFSIALPLKADGRVLGVLNLYSGEGDDVFDARELALLEELADDLAYGIAALRLRAERERSEQALRKSEARLREAQQIAHLGSWELDLTSNKLTWSDEIFRIFGADPRAFDASYEAFLNAVHPEDREMVDRAYTDSVRNRTPYDLVHRLLLPDGSVKAVHERCETHYDAAGRPLRSLGTVQDITERRQAEETLRHAEERLRLALEGSRLALWDTDISSGRVYLDERWAEMLGEAPRETETTLGALLKQVHPDDRAALARVPRAVLDGTLTEYRIEHRVRARGGEWRWILSRGKVVERDAAGRALRMIGTNADITERKRYQEELEHRATHDSLTGLANRVLLADRITQATAYASRSGRAAAVLFLDLDRFKVINDGLGHSQGDLLLQAVAGRLGACVRGGDTVARIGGDEFVVVMADMAHPDDVVPAIRKLQRALAQPVMVGDQDLAVTASIGVALHPRDGHDADTLLRNADAAMHRAKQDGGDGFAFFTPELQSAALGRLGMEAALRRALELGEFRLVYQPRVDLNTGKVLGAEALLRWQRGGSETVPPAKFIPLAEETGLIVPIGEWVLQTACEQARAWQAQGLPPVRISVNLSARQFRQPNLVGVIRQALRLCELEPDAVELEITESVLMSNPEAAATMLGELKDLGITLSLDDFGTGYSSLGYLKRFPIDCLKIDGSFVRDITTDPDDAAIALAVVALARSLELRVVAEGVETRDQLDFLRSHRCDEAQGYLIAEPLPADEFASWLRRGTPVSLH